MFAMAGAGVSLVMQWYASLADAGPWLVLFLPVALLLPGKAAATEIVWGDRIEVASGEAYRGPWRMNESNFHYVDDPSVAIDNQGSVGVVWADQARQDIFFQLFEADGRQRFAEPVNVSRSPDIFSWLPRVVLVPDDPKQVHVLWQEIVFSGGTHGGEIFFVSSNDGGQTFGDPLNLSNTPAGAGKGRYTREFWQNGSFDLVRSPKGDLLAAWTEYEGALWFSRSTDRGRSFTDPLRIAGGEGELPAHGPSLAVYDETVHLAWAVGEKSAADIRYARSDDGGRTFGMPEILFPSDGHSDAPKLAVDVEGTVHLVYSESPAGPMQQYDIMATRLPEGGKGFEEPREISGPHPGEFKSANFPSLDVDGEGRVYVLWELFPEAQIRPRGVGLTFSDDRGNTFVPPLVVPGSIDPELGINGGQQGLLMRKLAVNQAGKIAIVHSTFNPDVSSHVWLIRGVVAADSGDKGAGREQE
jgi:hypothetical protein